MRCALMTTSPKVSRVILAPTVSEKKFLMAGMRPRSGFYPNETEVLKVR